MFIILEKKKFSLRNAQSTNNSHLTDPFFFFVIYLFIYFYEESMRLFCLFWRLFACLFQRILGVDILDKYKSIGSKGVALKFLKEIPKKYQDVIEKKNLKNEKLQFITRWNDILAFFPVKWIHLFIIYLFFVSSCQIGLAFFCFFIYLFIWGKDNSVGNCEKSAWDNWICPRLWQF